MHISIHGPRTPTGVAKSNLDRGFIAPSCLGLWAENHELQAFLVYMYGVFKGPGFSVLGESTHLCMSTTISFQTLVGRAGGSCVADAGYLIASQWLDESPPKLMSKE